MKILLPKEKEGDSARMKVIREEINVTKWGFK